MARVSIVTNLHAQCGVTEYSKHLSRALSRFYDGQAPELITLDKWPMGGEVLLLNWHPSRMRLTVDLMQQMKAAGRKVVLIYQNSYHDGNNLLDPWGTQVKELRKVVDAVVSHEPIAGWPVDYVPHGILEVSGLPPVNQELTFGTAGFPLPHKRVDVAVKACQRYKARANFVWPSHDYLSFPHIQPWLKEFKGQVITKWLSAEDVIRQLARSTVNIFWFQSVQPKDLCGQSGGVRLGVAARRPIVLSRHRKFHTLFDYEDEIYFAETEADLTSVLDGIARNIATGIPLRCPDRVIRDQGWSKAAEKYQQAIERTMA